MFNLRKLQRIEEDKINVRISRMNDELLEHLASTLGYILHQNEKHGLNIPNREQIQASVRKAHSLLSDMSTLGSFDLSTEGKHDKDNRQGNRTCVKVLYN
jgi:hypothetical protein